jgi:cytoskeleton protein RodZ
VNRPEAEIAELPTDPGARLRRQRELAGLDVQQVAERLNLDVVVVQALESDDYAALGAPVFVRGHIRRYASLLGQPGEEILGAYDRSRAQLAPPTLVPKSRVEMAPPRGPVIPKWAVVSGLLLIVAAGVVAYVGEFGLHLPDTGVARDSVVAAGASAAAANERSAPGSTEGTRPGAGIGQGGPAPAGKPATTGVEASAVVPAGQVALLFAFAADSWIEVYDGSGKAVLYDLGQAGTERAVAGVAPLSVTLGNAPGVSLTVNGKHVTLPSPPPGETVARFGVAADGLQR